MSRFFPTPNMTPKKVEEVYNGRVTDVWHRKAIVPHKCPQCERSQGHALYKRECFIISIYCSKLVCVVCGHETDVRGSSV